MLINIYCVPHEKDSRKFIFHVHVHKFTANAALRVIDLYTQQNSNQANIDRSEFGINQTPSPLSYPRRTGVESIAKK